MDFLIHPSRWINDEENARAPPKLERYWWSTDTFHCGRVMGIGLSKAGPLMFLVQLVDVAGHLMIQLGTSGAGTTSGRALLVRPRQEES